MGATACLSVIAVASIQLGGNVSMKNRLLCLVLCLVLVLSAFLTGCSKEEEDSKETVSNTSSESARSLTMWVVSENEVDSETASAVSAALNSITKSKFKTNLVINFLTEDVYEQVISETIRAYEDGKSTLNPAIEEETVQTPSDGETTEYVEETDTNEYGLVVTKYPDLKPNQVDIIYIAGKDMYQSFAENGWLYALDSELSAASKKISEYVSNTLLSAAKLNNVTYAIPNNNTIGEYTYMLLDKSLMEENNLDGIYQQGKIDGFFNEYIFSYLQWVHAQHSDILPVDASYEDCLNLLAHYWSINPDTYDAEEKAFSFLGYRYTDPAKLSRGQTVLSFNSLFADEVFNENYIKLNEFKYDGYFGEAADGQKVAIRFCTGDLSDYEKLSKEYYPVIVKYPSVNVDDVYSSMFGVCQYSVDTSRSMQVLTYLNTNADFRNILQYGVEGVHYRFVEQNGTQVLERLNNNYMMDLFKTGNAFIAYPEPTMSADVWEVGKQQNRQALVEPLLDFDFRQIAYNSASVSTSTPQYGSSGYTYTYSTGYSKEILSQNSLLKKWIDESDAAGGGVYVLHTSVVSGQNVTGVIYYYNNQISATGVSVTDSDGSVSVDYTGTAGSGYELTVISFYGRKNSSKLNWNAAVNGSAVGTKVKYQNSVLNFDFMNTEGYAITLNSDLTKGNVYDNQAIWSWITENASSTVPVVGKYVKTVGEGADAKKIYTYVFYVNSISNPYAVTVQPTGDRSVLKLDIRYTVDTSAALSSTAPKYALFAISVTADAQVQEVQFNLSVDGNANPTVSETQFEEDPEFALCGNLDTELVRYLYRVNTKICELLDACTTVDELSALVADLKILLKPITEQPFEDVDAVADLLQVTELKEYVDTLNLEQFYWYLYCATSKSAVTHKELNDEDKLEDVKTHPVTGEAYVYYSSPYMLYYDWLKSNGFAK